MLQNVLYSPSESNRYPLWEQSLSLSCLPIPPDELRAMGFEPISSAWKADNLALDLCPRVFSSPKAILDRLTSSMGKTILPSQQFSFSECGAVGSVLGLGPSGRRFESCHSEDTQRTQKCLPTSGHPQKNCLYTVLKELLLRQLYFAS